MPMPKCQRCTVKFAFYGGLCNDCREIEMNQRGILSNPKMHLGEHRYIKVRIDKAVWWGRQWTVGRDEEDDP